MIKKENMLDLNANRTIKLEGFLKAKKYIYVQMYNNTMWIYTKKQKESSYCFKVKVRKNRTITDQRFVWLVVQQDLIGKSFIIDEKLGIYISYI